MNSNQKLIIVLITLTLILFLAISNVHAWNCGTHEYICDQIGHPEWDCCRADKEHIPSSYYHHCEGGPENPVCSAMVKAKEYNDFYEEPEIAAHLFADAMCPAHWYSLDSYDHSRFEDLVDNCVTGKSDNCDITRYAIDKNGNNITLHFDKEYLQETIDFVAEHMNATIQEPQQDRYVTIFEKILMWIMDLFEKVKEK